MTISSYDNCLTSSNVKFSDEKGLQFASTNNYLHQYLQFLYITTIIFNCFSRFSRAIQSLVQSVQMSHFYRMRVAGIRIFISQKLVIFFATLKNTNSKHFKCSCIITFSTHTPHTPHPCPVTKLALYITVTQLLDIKHKL